MSKVMQNSAILSTFIKLPIVFKTFVLSILSDRLRHISLYANSKGFDEPYTNMDVAVHVGLDKK